ncbi:MAG: hypothetical protein ACRDWE_08715 [Acidimicrobiales bacterium]
MKLPRTVLQFLGVAAERLRRVDAAPGSAAYARLFGRVDEEHPTDDPVVVLTRQLMVDEIAAAVSASCANSSISDEEAEAWLAVLGMTVSLHASELGVDTDEARDALGDEDRAFIAALQHLQLCLIDALDAPTPTDGPE